MRAAREALQAAHRRRPKRAPAATRWSQLQSRVQQSGEIGDWLKAHGLADAQPLWRGIQVEAGWETAVEAVLRERLSALAGDRELARQALAAPPPATLSLGAARRAPAAQRTAAPGRCAPRCVATMRRWRRCSTSGWPASRRPRNWPAELPAAGEIWVNRAGHLLTPHGLTLYVPDARTHGVIERQREIEELAALIEARELEEEALRAKPSGQAEQRLAESQEQLASRRRATQEAQQRLHAAQVEALKLTQAQARYDERAGQIARDLEEIVRGEENERAELAARRSRGAAAAASSWTPCAPALEAALERSGRRTRRCARRAPWSISWRAKRRRPAFPSANAAPSWKTMPGPPRRRESSWHARRARDRRWRAPELAGISDRGVAGAAAVGAGSARRAAGVGAGGTAQCAGSGGGASCAASRNSA